VFWILVSIIYVAWVFIKYKWVIKHIYMPAGLFEKVFTLIVCAYPFAVGLVALLIGASGW
jgi:hypothetical protein